MYVRELLKLVLNNALTPKEKVSLASIYDILETHAVSLSRIVAAGRIVTRLAEAYEERRSDCRERTRTPAVPVVATPKDHFTNLMSFLQDEVENEERIVMAPSGFSLGNERAKEKNKKIPRRESNNEAATAAALSIV